MSPTPTRFRNGQALPLSQIPELGAGAFRETLLERINAGGRIASFFGFPVGEGVGLMAVLAFDSSGVLEVLRCGTVERFPSMTPELPQAHWFEREIAEQWGVAMEGHPWPKPIRFQRPFQPSRGGASTAAPLPGVTEYFRVEGEQTHEVAVGPVHAGIIEPGHFRFQCHGERVFHLEISLGYQHRGIERALRGGPDGKTMLYTETLAGDTSVGHATACALVQEALSAEAAVPARAEWIRAIALELERVANHTGDLGALANDIGFLPTSAYCGRLRGDFLNMTLLLCGNRFGRSLVRPGGVRFDISEATRTDLLRRIAEARRDLEGAISLLWTTPLVMARFEETGTVSREACLETGLVGPACRACGVERDVRYDFPWGAYRTSHIPPSTWDSGDVFARAEVRWLEIQRSLDFATAQLESPPSGPIITPVKPASGGALAVSLVEGWRGEICHTALTEAKGRFMCYKVVDPSFHNWFGLALALRDQQISDFPLCNKSFNLSYCGHDL
jgi:Ni,Fe-hydrogenase III large subunit